LPFQQVNTSSVTVEPSPVWERQDNDYFGNLMDRVEVLEPHDRLVVTALSEVSVQPREVDRGLPALQQAWELARDCTADDPTCFDSREFALDSPLVRRHPRLLGFANQTFSGGRPVIEALLEFNHRIYSEFTYDPSVTDVATPLGQVMREKRGVCQDFAHVAVGALRSVGLAARYVSGYLETLPPAGKPRLVGADASHAWASLFVPGFGWLDFDPTNDLLPSHRHVVVAWGRDFSDVSPLKGVVLGGGRHSVRVGVDVEPIVAKPRALPA
jgi:transglutaminase-like putative cysteine protease